MPIEQLDPDAIGTNNNWGNFGGAGTKVIAVTDGTDVTYIAESGETSQKQSFQVAPASGSYSSYSACTYYYREKKAGVGSAYGISTDDNYTTTYTNAHGITTSWVWYTDDLIDAGGDWAYQNFVANNVEIGMLESGGAGDKLVSEMYILLDYSAGGAAFVWMSWLPPLLAAGANLFGNALLYDDVKVWEWMTALFRDGRYNMNLPIHPKTGKPHVIFPSMNYKNEREVFWNAVCRRPVYNF